MSIPTILCQSLLSQSAESVLKKTERNGLAWWWGCRFLSPSLSIYCQEILTSLDCQAVTGTLLLNWERKLAGFCALCSTTTALQKQEPGALYEGTGEVKGRVTRVIYQGIVPDKMLTWRWWEFDAYMLCQETEWLSRSLLKCDMSSSESSLSIHEEVMTLCSRY